MRSDEPGRAGHQRLHSEHLEHARGQPARPAIAPSAAWIVCPAPTACRRPPGALRSRSGCAPASARVAAVRISISSSYRAGCRYSQWASMTGSETPACFHLAIAPAGVAQPLGPARPRTTRGSSRSRRRPSDRFRRSARARACAGPRDRTIHPGSCWPRRARPAWRASGSAAPKIAWPATRMFAPAATTSATLASSMPPSISMGADEPAARQHRAHRAAACAACWE